MRISALLRLILSCCLVVPSAYAIHADEAYQVDYHYPLIGQPRAETSFFLKPGKSNAALIYTLSERHVLGAVNPKDGQLLWRQPLGDNANQTRFGLLKARASTNTLISAVGGHLQAWDALDGRSSWMFSVAGHITALEILTGADGGDDLLVAYDAGQGSVAVQRRALGTGQIQWTHEATKAEAPFVLVPSANLAFYVALPTRRLGGHRIVIHQLDLGTGTEEHQSASLADAEIQSEDDILFAGNSAGTPLLIWTDKHHKVIKTNVLGTKLVSSIDVTPAPGETVENIKVHSAQIEGALPCFLIHYQTAASHWAELYHVLDGGSKISKAFDLPVASGSGAFSSSSVGGDTYFVRHTTAEIELISSTSTKPLAQWKLPELKLDLTYLSHATSEVLSKAGKYSVRSALTVASGDWTLVRNGELLWSRPEGLAGAAAIGFAELIDAGNLFEELITESHSSVINAYLHRVSRHVKQLHGFAQWVRSLPEVIVQSFSAEEDQILPRPSFGFNKMVIVATEDGRLAALEAGNRGRVLWSSQVVELPASEKWHVLSIETEGGNVLVRAPGGEFLRVHAKTGAVVAHQRGAMIASLRTTVPVADTQGKSHMIPVNDDGTLGAIPSIEFAYRTVVVTKGKDGVIRGWILTGQSKAVLCWTFDAGPGHEIKSVQSRPSHDPVASIGRALGDRNVLYKYLNPNILLISTVNAKTSTAGFYLVDSTSGSILHSIHHPNVDISLPISSTVSENFFAYSLFSGSEATLQDLTASHTNEVRGYQLVIAEIFESRYPNDRGPLGEAVNHSSTRPYDGDGAEEAGGPHVISQTFLIPGPISHMITSSTSQGITPRSLLCTLPHLNALISIPRHVLDPRRPVGRDPTALEAEEGLFRYSPMLDFEPKWIVNHKRELLSISKVAACPSKLESTSIIFAFGALDLFGTRISPIGSFDMLGKGFSKFQLVATVVALGIGTSLLAPFVRRKQINAQWQT